MKKASLEIKDLIKQYETANPSDALYLLCDMLKVVPGDIPDAEKRLNLYVDNLAFLDVGYDNRENYHMLRLYYDLYKVVEIKLSRLRDKKETLVPGMIRNFAERVNFQLYGFDEFLQRYRYRRNVHEVEKKIGLIRSDLGLSTPSSPLAYVRIIQRWLEDGNEKEFKILHDDVLDGEIGRIMENHLDELLELLTKEEGKKLKKFLLNYKND
jgi:hypothetical protein